MATDPMGKLFSGLTAITGQTFMGTLFGPTPGMDPATVLDRLVNSPSTIAKAVAFVKEAQSVPPTSLDADTRLLLQHALHAVNTNGGPVGRPDLLLSGIADVAVKATIRPGDTSHKAGYLEFFRWLAMGKKDEEAPDKKHPVTNETIDHAHLPKNPDAHKCAGCGHTDSRMMICTGCLLRTDGHTTFVTAYCSKVCQTAHWKKHKTACKGQQRFQRAASTFQAVFYLFMEYISDPSGQRTKISEENGVLCVDSITSDMELGLGYRGDSVLSRMFALLGTTAPSEEARRAALMTEGCAEIMGTALSLFELLIRPTITSLEKIRVTPRNVHKPTRESKGPSGLVNYTTLWDHFILGATIPGGQRVILDFSAPQFGWAEYIAPAEHYIKHRVATIRETTREPFLGNPMLDMQQLMDPTSAIVNKKRREAAESLAATLKSHMVRSLGGYDKLLNAKGDEFKTAQEALIKKAESALEAYLRSFQQGHLYRFYLSAELAILVVDDGELYGKLKKVWYSKDKYEKLKGTPAVLRRVYLHRYRKAVGN
ncbi:hypothetical protein OQA88_16 [Cercophora sp. LCS_1]